MINCWPNLANVERAREKESLHPSHQTFGVSGVWKQKRVILEVGDNVTFLTWWSHAVKSDCRDSRFMEIVVCIEHTENLARKRYSIWWAIEITIPFPLLLLKAVLWWHWWKIWSQNGFTPCTCSWMEWEKKEQQQQKQSCFHWIWKAWSHI